MRKIAALIMPLAILAGCQQTTDTTESVDSAERAAQAELADFEANHIEPHTSVAFRESVEYFAENRNIDLTILKVTMFRLGDDRYGCADIVTRNQFGEPNMRDPITRDTLPQVQWIGKFDTVEQGWSDNLNYPSRADCADYITRIQGQLLPD